MFSLRTGDLLVASSVGISSAWSFHLLASLVNKRACALPYRCGKLRSNAAVVRATGKQCCCLPLHCKEGDCPKETNNHHDQELPLQKEVVAVEKCNSCTDGLMGKEKVKDFKWRYPPALLHKVTELAIHTAQHASLSMLLSKRQQSNYTTAYVPRWYTTDLVCTYLNRVHSRKWTHLKSVWSMASTVLLYSKALCLETTQPRL